MKQTPVRAAMASVEPYRDHIATIMNHIKHQQGALRGVVVFNENRVIPGYFVEHIGDEKGEAALEPHPDVHPLFRGEHTAFSFFRDLRFNFWLVYAVSEILADTIVQIAQPTPNILDEQRSDKKVHEVAERISRLPKWTFKDEALQDFPEIELINKEGIDTLTMEYPSTKTILPAKFGTDTVLNGWIDDGVTHSHRPPYFQGKISALYHYF